MSNIVQSLKDQAIIIDKDISYRIYTFNRKFQTSKKYWKALEYSCHGIPWLVIVGILLYTTEHNRFWAKLMVGLLFDIIYVAISKSFSRRQRPWYAVQDEHVLIKIDKLSFPSGHASRSVYVGLLFSNYWFGSLVWIWVAAVIVSRVLYGRHFIGDILGGIALGWFNFITQTSIFYPVNAFLVWFLTSFIGETIDNY